MSSKKTETETASPVESVREAASATVKTFTQMYVEGCEKILGEAEKSMTRSFAELDRAATENGKLVDAQLKASKDFVAAALESTRKMTAGLGQ